MQGSDLAPILQPQQPVRPYWMGDQQNNLLWEVVQGDWLAYWIQMFCGCPGLVPDITGWIFLFEVKESLDPLDPNTLIQVVWNEQRGNCAATALFVQGYQTAMLPPGRYAWDLKYMTPGGIIKTVGRGELNVLPSSNTVLASLTSPLIGVPLVRRNSRFEATMARILKKKPKYYRADKR